MEAEAKTLQHTMVRSGDSLASGFGRCRRVHSNSESERCPLAKISTSLRQMAENFLLYVEVAAVSMHDGTIRHNTCTWRSVGSMGQSVGRA
jgi:hypothetical protein